MRLLQKMQQMLDDPDDNQAHAHDAVLLGVLGLTFFILMFLGFGFMLLGATLLSLGGVGFHVFGYLALAVSFAAGCALIYLLGLRLWIDFGRPIKRWFQRRRPTS